MYERFFEMAFNIIALLVGVSTIITCFVILYYLTHGGDK